MHLLTRRQGVLSRVLHEAHGAEGERVPLLVAPWDGHLEAALVGDARLAAGVVDGAAAVEAVARAGPVALVVAAQALSLFVGKEKDGFSSLLAKRCKTRQAVSRTGWSDNRAAHNTCTQAAVSSQRSAAHPGASM